MAKILSDITIGKYLLSSDGGCVSLSIKRKSKDKNNDYQQYIGHFPNTLTALDRLLEERMAGSDMKSVQDLKEEIIKTRKIIKKCLMKYGGIV